MPRLTNLAGTAYDQTLGFGYNAASQIASTTRSNEACAWTAHGGGTTSTSAGGRNRLAGWNAALGHEGKASSPPGCPCRQSGNSKR